jgi:DNA-binding FrmR family transcriptional regulator
MKKRKKTEPVIERSRPSLNGRRAGGASDAAAAPSPCCGCAAAYAATSEHEGVGPGAHAAGVDDGLKAVNLKHLKRIEGQVRGIAAMIEENRYCADIIQQCAAVQESLRAVAKNLLRNHLEHCASRAMHGDKQQQDAMTEELIDLVGRIAR